MKLVWMEICTMHLLLQPLGSWSSADSFNHVCYMTSPTNNREALPFDKVDVRLCSHIILGFATVGRDYTVDLSSLGGQDVLASFAQLKKQSPSLKLMISIHGGESGRNFKEMVSTASNRKRLIESVEWMIKSYGFHGMDFDWDLPGYPDSANEFIEECSVVFKKDPERPLLLSVAVPAVPRGDVVRYRFRSVAQSADFVNLKTYNFHTYHWYSPFVGHNSPLFPRSGELPILDMLNVASSAKFWAEMGMPKTQIMVGIPTFGHSWVLQNPARWQVGSMATGPGRRGGGYVSFAEVCSLLQGGAKREYDNESKVPFLHKGKLWISYDDMDSVAQKAAWIRSNGYGGTMTFSLGTDDWTGKCGYGAFPLQNAIAYPKNDNRSEHFY